MGLIYLWVAEYKNIKNQGFNFSPRFECEYKDGNLIICDKKKKECKNIDITLKEQFTNIYDKYIEIFKLNERYKAHKDMVYDIIQKAEFYPESRLKELQDLTDIPYQQIKKDIFNLIDENEDLSKQPFSKLIVDMSKELKII